MPGGSSSRHRIRAGIFTLISTAALVVSCSGSSGGNHGHHDASTDAPEEVGATPDTGTDAINESGTPEAASPDAGDSASDAIPDSTSDAVGDSSVDAVSDSAPDAFPDSAPDAPTDAAPDVVSCGSSQKECSGTCQSLDDPAYGCASQSCTPCVTPNHATSICSAGACSFSCDSGYANCDGDAQNGCEADLSHPATCGGCNNWCIAPAHAVATCQSGTCGFKCAFGYGDCDGDKTNGCESPLTANPNCGGCGRSCTTSCTVPSGGTGSCAPSTLTGVGGSALALDTSDVVYVSAQWVNRVAKTGGTPATLATGHPQEVTTDGNYIYYTDSGTTANTGSVIRMDQSGGGSTTIASALSDPRGIIADPGTGGNVYVLVYGQNKVLAIPKAGGTATTLATNQTSLTGIAQDANNVFWTNFAPSGYVRGRDKALASAVVSYGSVPRPGALAADATDLWVNGNISGASENVYRIDRSGGSPAPFANCETNLSGGLPDALAADASSVYCFGYSSGSDVVYRIAKADAAETPLATTSAFGGTFSLAVDSTYVYWVTNAGVFRTTK